MAQKVLVFDGRKWTKDIGDNRQFWRKAEVISEYQIKGTTYVDVKYQDGGDLTTGHFKSGVYCISDTEWEFDSATKLFAKYHLRIKVI